MICAPQFAYCEKFATHASQAPFWQATVVTNIPLTAITSLLPPGVPQKTLFFECCCCLGFKNNLFVRKLGPYYNKLEAPLPRPASFSFPESSLSLHFTLIFGHFGSFWDPKWPTSDIPPPSQKFRSCRPRAQKCQKFVGTHGTNF